MYIGFSDETWEQKEDWNGEFVLGSGGGGGRCAPECNHSGPRGLGVAVERPEGQVEEAGVPANGTSKHLARVRARAWNEKGKAGICEAEDGDV